MSYFQGGPFHRCSLKISSNNFFDFHCRQHGSNSLSDFMGPHTESSGFHQLTEYINKIRDKRSSSKVTHHRRQAEEIEPQVALFGIRVEAAGSDWGDDGVVKLLSHSTVRIRLFGQHLSSRTVLAFTSTKDPGDGTCEFPASEIFLVSFLAISSIFSKCLIICSWLMILCQIIRQLLT